MIHILPPAEARKIAAGEVIDRPASLVRELIDNAIDAGGLNIDVLIEGGGIKRIEVVDDGSGMNKADLALACVTHATSKIRGVDDLKTARTLGFRGEALSSAAAVARIEIVTSHNGQEAWQLLTDSLDNEPVIEPARRQRGTSVRAFSLFDNIPARKRFLKREGSEAQLCKQVFLEKAAAFPDFQFRFFQDGKLKIFLPKTDSLKDRFAAAFLQPDVEMANKTLFLHEIAANGEGFSASIIIGGPELFRNDRRQQFIFANGRRINDFSLQQALEFGTQGWFPNGTHPVGAVFIEIDPALADFNIHPAKREARFSDAGAIHHSISSCLRNFLRNYGAKSSRETSAEEFLVFPHPKPVLPVEKPGNYTGYAVESPVWAVSDVQEPAYGTNELNDAGEVGNEEVPGGVKLTGRLFDLFILVERGESLFVIDQHAAHERILYNKLLSAPIPRQELLIPIPFNTESAEDDRFLESRREALKSLGVVISGGGGDWRIEALPVLWRLSDSQTVQEILELRTASESIAERWAATVACHAAVRDGTYIDDESALSLAKEALALPDPHCPHGRPVWTVIERGALLKAVRRT
ncbi:DNA mismatch repair protein MutL [Spirochaetia bacterium]|nr:DNA mismatch repair protein MutL [Spirochaetia bacterium]